MTRYLILDRDGTINRDTGYTYKIEDLEILPGVIEGLQKFRDTGFKFIIVANQAGIARKIFAPADLNNFNGELIRQLGADGIKIEKIYHCPHHPHFTGECLCRKPNTGLVGLAQKEHGFNSSSTIVVGDKDSDIELGKNCGALTILIENDQYLCATEPDLRARDINHAFELLKLAGKI